MDSNSAAAAESKDPPAPGTLQCASCQKWKAPGNYSKGQRKKKAQRRCPGCLGNDEAGLERAAKRRKLGKTYLCTYCEEWKAGEDFNFVEGGTRKMKNQMRHCNACKDLMKQGIFKDRLCGCCDVVKHNQPEHFAHPEDSKCTTCVNRERNERDERIRQAFATCAGCQTSKIVEGFNATERLKARKDWHCLECKPVLGEEEREELCDAVMLLTRREFETQGIRNALKIKRETDGCVCYDFEHVRCRFSGDQDVVQPPRLVPYLDLEGSEIDEASMVNPFDSPFQQEEPSPSDFYGTYEILFHSYYDWEEGVQRDRTCKGSFTLAPGTDSWEAEEEEEVRDQVLRFHSGPEGVGIGRGVYGLGSGETTFEFTSVIPGDDDGDSVQGSDWCVEFSHDHELCSDDDFTGTLQIFREHMQLPWLLCERNKDERYDIDEIREVVERPDYGKSWLCHHLPVTLDALVVKQIHDYVSWRPDPSFSIQPGDLFLNMEGSSRASMTGFVARLRVPEDPLP